MKFKNVKHIFKVISCLLLSQSLSAQVSLSPGIIGSEDSVVIYYDVTINNPLSASVVTVSTQGSLSAGATISTDDPDTVPANDATLTNVFNSWSGATSTAWNNISNWTSSTVPTNATNVTLEAGLPNMPLVDITTAACSNLLIGSGATLGFSGTNNKLAISGAITNNGIFNAINGVVGFEGAAAQTIPAGLFSGNTIDGLTINNAAGVALGGTLNITGVLTSTTGTFTTGGFLTLKSTLSNTARVAPVNGAISGTTTIERFIPGLGNRAWRLLGVPITSSGAPTIYSSWQESGGPTVGFGTQITQASGTAAANSWDAGIVSLLPSIYQYNSGSNSLTAPSGTNIPITNQSAWFLFVRGDRTVSGPNVSGNTTLRMTGNLKTGNQDFPVPATNFAAVGNPYASPIDFALAKGNAATTSSVLNKFWVWDPKLNILGGYVLFDGGLGYSPSVTGGSYNSATSIIQSGQGFFVQSNGTAGNLRIQEDDKAATHQDVFKTTSPTAPMIKIKLEIADPAVPGFIPADGVIGVFENIFSAATDNDDGAKFSNFGANLSLVRNNHELTIEKRPDATSNDTLYTRLTNLAVGNYQLVVDVINWSNPNLAAYLVDNFLNTTIPLNMNNALSIPFTTTSNVLTSGLRYQVVFQNVVPLTDNSIAVYAERVDANVKVSWSVENEDNVNNYSIERSNDGKMFDKLAGQYPEQRLKYDYLDISATKGTIYYRIKTAGNNNKEFYSRVVKVKSLATDGKIIVMPNPIEGNIISLSFDNVESGVYTATLYDASGQLIYSERLNHGGGPGIHTITIGQSIASGAYTLKVSGGDKVIIQKLIK